MLIFRHVKVYYFASGIGELALEFAKDVKAGSTWTSSYYFGGADRPICGGGTRTVGENSITTENLGQEKRKESKHKGTYADVVPPSAGLCRVFC